MAEPNPSSIDLEKDRQLVSLLHKLADRQWVANLLEEGLTQIALKPVRVEDFELKFAKVYPAACLAVYLQARVSFSQGRPPFWQGLSMIFPPGNSREQTKNLSNIQIKRTKSPGFALLEGRLNDPEAVIRLFPYDPVLTGLASATDPNNMEDVFFNLRKDSPTGFHILSYKPERSCTIRYELEGTGTVPQALIGKISSKEDAIASARKLAWAQIAAKSSGGLWKAPQLLDSIPDRGLILQDALNGNCLFADLIYRGEGRLGEAQQDLHNIAAALRSFQKSNLENGSLKDFDTLLRHQEQCVLLLKAIHPETGCAVEEVLAKIRSLESKTSPSPIGPAHGDFGHWNILIDEEGPERIGLIDFDNCCRAEFCFDAAYLLQAIAMLALKQKACYEPLMKCRDYFRNTYLDTCPEVDPKRLALFEALEYTSSVQRSLLKTTSFDKWKKRAVPMLRLAEEALAGI